MKKSPDFDCYEDTDEIGWQMKQFATTLFLVLVLFGCSDTENKKGMNNADHLMQSIKSGNILDESSRKYLIGINEIGQNGVTPLYFALTQKDRREEVIAYLVHNGANPFQPIPKYNTFPIRKSLVYDSASMFKLLACSKYDINTVFISSDTNNKLYERYPTILFDAVVQGDAEKLEIILDCGGYSEVRNDRGQTAILVTPPSGHRVMEILIDRGANLEVRDNSGVGVCDRLLSLSPGEDGKTRNFLLGKTKQRGLICRNYGDSALN